MFGFFNSAQKNGHLNLRRYSASNKAIASPTAMEIVMIGCWCIWIQRNGKVFRAIQPTLFNWKHTMKLEMKNLQFKIKAKNLEALKKYLTDNFV